MAFDSWPPKRAVTRRLYTHADKTLSFEPPRDPSSSGFDSYVSDPANPVPYRPRPIRPTFTGGSTWGRWLGDDQRFLEGRSDVLTWKTEPLAEDVVVAGSIAAHLFASTTGSDADWVVKLIDVYPEDAAADPKLSGYQLMVANDVMRARFPQRFVPNIFQAKDSDFQSATQRIYRAASAASYVELPVLRE